MWRVAGLAARNWQKTSETWPSVSIGPSSTASRHTWSGLSAGPFFCLLHAACSDIYRRARIGPDLQVIYRSIKPPSTNSSAPVV